MAAVGLGDTSSRGNQPGELGDALPFVNLGTGRTAKAIACGRYHTCAILDDGRVKCWGFNEDGRLGLGDSNNRGDQPGEMGDALAFVNLGPDVPQRLSRRVDRMHASSSTTVASNVGDSTATVSWDSATSALAAASSVKWAMRFPSSLSAHSVPHC